MAENRYSVLVPIAGAVHVVVTAMSATDAADKAFEGATELVARVSVPAPDCGLGLLESLDAYERIVDGKICCVPTRAITVRKLKEGE